MAKEVATSILFKQRNNKFVRNFKFFKLVDS